MGNRIVRVIFGIILGIGALVGVYFALPGSIKHPLQEKIQGMFFSSQQQVADYYKNVKLPVEGLEDMTFNQMLEGAGSSVAWVVSNAEESEDKTTGTYDLTAYAYDVDISMAQENGQENRKSFTKAAVEIFFSVVKKADGTYKTNSWGIRIDEELQNEFYRTESMRSMYSHAKAGKKSD